MARKKHIVIAGTGRAGTTFLVQLLTQLGMDTGFTDPWDARFLDSNAKAGMETHFAHPNAPTFLKGPAYSAMLDQLIREGKISVQHVIIPVRDLFSAAESRRRVQRDSKLPWYRPAAGGLVNSSRPEDQEAALAQNFYELFATLAKRDIGHTVLSFPRFVQDPEYAYSKLKVFVGDHDFASFHAAFNLVAKPQWVHRFSKSESTVLHDTDEPKTAKWRSIRPLRKLFAS